MSAQSRIKYAVSIKHWCDTHPGATDQELVEFLERIEHRVVHSCYEHPKENGLTSSWKSARL